MKEFKDAYVIVEILGDDDNYFTGLISFDKESLIEKCDLLNFDRCYMVNNWYSKINIEEYCTQKFFEIITLQDAIKKYNAICSDIYSSKDENY